MKTPKFAAITGVLLSQVLAPKGGLFGAMGERGLGGSKCGATAAIALLYEVRPRTAKPLTRVLNAPRCSPDALGTCFTGPSVMQGKGGAKKVLAANAGDARVILARKGKAVQLSEDHVPDSCAISSTQTSCLTAGVDGSKHANGLETWFCHDAERRSENE